MRREVIVTTPRRTVACPVALRTVAAARSYRFAGALAAGAHAARAAAVAAWLRRRRGAAESGGGRAVVVAGWLVLRFGLARTQAGRAVATLGVACRRAGPGALSAGCARAAGGALVRRVRQPSPAAASAGRTVGAAPARGLRGAFAVLGGRGARVRFSGGELIVHDAGGAAIVTAEGRMLRETSFWARRDIVDHAGAAIADHLGAACTEGHEFAQRRWRTLLGAPAAARGVVVAAVRRRGFVAGLAAGGLASLALLARRRLVSAAGALRGVLAYPQARYALAASVVCAAFPPAGSSSALWTDAAGDGVTDATGAAAHAELTYTWRLFRAGRHLLAVGDIAITDAAGNPISTLE